MGCFSCTGKSSKKSKEGKRDNKNSKKQGGGGDQRQPSSGTLSGTPNVNVNKEEDSKEDQLSLDAHTVDLKDDDTSTIGKKAQTFKFQELVDATGNFNPSCFLGEGGFGKVYKGHFSDTNQEVAIKQLDPDGVQGIREFVVEVLTLSLADHPNLVKLIGYCAEGDQRLLVYEYMPLGSLENHLHDLPRDRHSLNWNLRMKIAAGAASGLDFGVVLLELITGRKAIDPTRDRKERNLVGWARPLFKDRKNFPSMVDPLLKGQYPRRGLYQALAIAAMCVQEEPSLRPKICDVVLALNYLATQSNFVTHVYPVQSSQSNNPSHSRVNRFDAPSRQIPPPRSKSN
ncbi:hypothetical protein Q3G72_030940 [Acer saccharum]|nr:hypothetical protein Q3G72_030940 [Acer saccharum]